MATIEEISIKNYRVLQTNNLEWKKILKIPEISHPVGTMPLSVMNVG